MHSILTYLCPYSEQPFIHYPHTTNSISLHVPNPLNQYYPHVSCLISQSSHHPFAHIWWLLSLSVLLDICMTEVDPYLLERRPRSCGGRSDGYTYYYYHYYYTITTTATATTTIAMDPPTAGILRHESLILPKSIYQPPNMKTEVTLR